MKRNPLTPNPLRNGFFQNTAQKGLVPSFLVILTYLDVFIYFKPVVIKYNIKINNIQINKDIFIFDIITILIILIISLCLFLQLLLS